MVSGDDILGGLAGALDAERFVGRTDALALAAAALGGQSEHRLLYVHGPAGVGKSGLLRAIERQAVAAGAEVHRLDGRAIEPSPDALLAAFEPVRSSADRLLVVLDEVDELVPLRFELRTLLLELPVATVIVLAGRPAPDREWFDGGLEYITADIPLRPFDAANSRELLRRHGLTDPAEVDPIVGWAGGYPIALTVAATSRSVPLGDEAVLAARASDDPSQLDELILSRLAGRELDGLDPDVLDVAGVAPVVDARLLAAVLPSRPTRAGLKQLRELSVSESVGNRTTLHRLVRSAVRTRLRETDPERYRTLVVAVAEHLRDRALSGEPRTALELFDLVEDPRSRSGYGLSTTHYVDRARPGDAERAGEILGVTGTAWWGRVTRWCDECPEQVIVVRAANGDLGIIGVVFSLDRMPAWAADDLETGPVVEHLRSLGAEHDAVFIQDIHVLHDPSDEAAVAEIIRIGNSRAFAVSGNPNPRYLVATAPFVRTGDGSEVWGYGEVESLRRRDDERQLVTTMADFGPEGAVGGICSMIRAEQFGVDDEGGSPGRGVAIVAGLRSFRDDEALAHGPLGEGEGTARVNSARAEVLAAIETAFDDTEADRGLRTALERAYIDADGGHAVARAELFMSRATFYRHLQRARDRLVASTP